MNIIGKFIALLIGVFTLFLSGCGGGDETANPFGVDLTDTSTSKTMSKISGTGQTTDYTATYGEDSDYNINPMSFTDNVDGTVTDNVTGLMWQQQDDGVNYNWYEANGTPDATYNTDGATNVCGDLNLAGYTDWRVPSKRELVSIANLNTFDPTIDVTYFPGTKSISYTSSDSLIDDPASTLVDESKRTITISFYEGKVFDVSKDIDINYVRCVRGKQPSASSFTDNNDSTVTDNVTGLMWQKAEGGYLGWDEAIIYCEGLNLAGYSDWKLPDYKELESLTEMTESSPTIDTTYFPDAVVNQYWSSTTNPYDASFSLDVNFFHGVMSGAGVIIGGGGGGGAAGTSPDNACKSAGCPNQYVRCVR